MARKDPPRLTDPYASGSEPPPAPEPVRSSLPSTPDLLPPPRNPSQPNLPPPRISQPGRGSTPRQPSQPDLGAPWHGPSAPPEPVFPLGAPPAATPRRRRVGLVLAIAAAALALAAAGIGVWLWLASRAAPVLPLALGTYPESTLLVGRDSGGVSYLGLSHDELPPEARWSTHAAALCGGHDVFRSLLYPSRRYARIAIAEAIEDRRQTGRALACGREMAQKERSRSVYWLQSRVETDDDEKPPRLRDEDKDDKDKNKRRRVPRSHVRLFDVDRKELPETAKRYREHRDRGGLVATHCELKEKDKPDAHCEKYARASAHLEGTTFWVAGSLEDIERFGKAFSPKGGNKIDNEDVWLGFAQRLEPFPYVEIGTFETFEPEFIHGTGLSLSYREDDDFRKLSEALFEAVAKYEAWWGFGDSVGARGGELRLELHAPSDSDAIDLLLDLREWQKALAEFFDKRDEAPADKDDLKKVEREFYETLDKAARRALKDATIERDGKIVRVIATVDYEDDEGARIEEMRKVAMERADLAAKVVQALAEGDKPDEDLLRDIGGGDLVDAVRDPEKAREDAVKAFE